ncbi:MAG: acetate--CoA ligase, partial [Neisseriaceae bacterium]|nr:acetate--CoA ligase [Neisseriaceae bacterium]
MTGITSILNETRLFAPPDDFRREASIQGRAQYQSLCDQAYANYEGYWAHLARTHIDWQQPFTLVFDGSQAPFYQWFADGQLNLSYNCLDRHLPHKAKQTALIFEHDDGTSERISYQHLYERVCQCANALKSLGVGKGDRVAIYLPMAPDAIVAMQACARIGAIHSVVFAGFSAASLKERIQDAEAKVVITATESVRGGKRTPLKNMVDQALEDGDCPSIEAVIVVQHTDTPVGWVTERDHWWHDLMATQANTCAPEWLSAEDVAFILYTSGSTGKPKGVVHSVGGYLLGAILTMKWVFDHHEDDVYWCTADVGWITGHTYVAYGPLAVGATQLIFEGVPTYPDANRFWQIIAKHQVSTFYTAPTAIRALIKLGSELPLRHDLSSLRLLGTVGEPINPEAWMWYHQVVGQGRCPIVDTWWQTETGANVIAPLPGAITTKPGSCTLPLPGIMADIVDEAGAPVADGT